MQLLSGGLSNLTADQLVCVPQAGREAGWCNNAHTAACLAADAGNIWNICHYEYVANQMGTGCMV